MTRSRFAGLALRLGAIAVLTGRVTTANADPPMIRLWPGDPPCETTLQACVDGAGPRDGIRIATNGPIWETITFSKPLALTAQPGFEPIFLGDGIFASTSDSGDQSIRIQGLVIGGGRIQVRQQSSGAATIDVENNAVDSIALYPAIEVDADPYNPTGPLSFVVSGNMIEVPLGPQGSGIVVVAGSSSASGSIARNEITMTGGNDGSAIEVDDLANDLSVDVIGNRIAGTDYDSGIELYGSGAGTLTARVLDNLVTGQNGTAGAPGAISAHASQAPLQLTIVNNTLAGNDAGILVGLNDASSTAVIANNALTQNVKGLVLDVAPGANISERNDLFFGNTSDILGAVAGPNSIFANPRYASGSDFHLQPGSPAIDAGDDGSVPVDLTTDLERSPRIQGAHVDIGAYEAPEPSAELSNAAAGFALAVGGVASTRRLLG
ncbi:MAG TPA: choice-of-anchor Q domain-containing protein [Solirubrobacteraceae bacterium]|nr:choice-of-anchor Q domain-containing protein [Solirubrobacteraceae bacterium]